MLKRTVGKHDKKKRPIEKAASEELKQEKSRREEGKHEKKSLPELEPLQKELKREKYKRRFRRVLRSTVSVLVVVAAVAALIATLVLPVLQIAGTSMEPSLSEGDIVALVKSGDLENGDLCAFYYSNKVLIKRVIAKPGDYLWMESDGTVVLNGEKLEEPYVTKKALGECDIEFPYQVPENHYFVMGDQRETSIDSRSSTIGCIAEDQIIGKLLCKFWPLTEFEWLA
ncbi:MAG: signal peptidase I [Ruminococcaceae bacterium]|nr:signal peptidase I [Oscillospiraceae bacterium]